MKVQSFTREEFLRDRFWYRPGEHLTIISPTDAGKTTLAFQLAGRVATPDLPAIVMVRKARDATVTRWAAQLGYRRVRTWPPLPSPWAWNPPGYVLWPRVTFDPRRDRGEQYKQFRSAIMHSYKKGNRIIFADELFQLTRILGLGDELDELWTGGRSMGCGLWTATQSPVHISGFAYNQAAHLFIGHDPDKRRRLRFAEIGGVDPDIVMAVVVQLRKYEWLYIRRHGRDGAELCVVDP